MGRECNLDLCLLPAGIEASIRSPDSVESRSEESIENSQKLTIFYNGRVSVCNVTEFQAKAILGLAKREMDERVQNHREASQGTDESRVKTHREVSREMDERIMSTHREASQETDERVKTTHREVSREMDERIKIHRQVSQEMDELRVKAHHHRVSQEMDERAKKTHREVSREMDERNKTHRDEPPHSRLEPQAPAALSVKRSLQRFLQKRLTRIHSTSPYSG